MRTVKSALLALALFSTLALASAALGALPANLFDLAETSETPGGETINVFPKHLFNVQATDLTLETGVRVSWTGSPDLEVYFNVYRDGTLLTELSSQDSVYVDTTALPLVSYRYSVQMRHYDNQHYHMGDDDGSRGFFRPQQSSGSMYSDTGGVELTWQDRSSIEDGFIIFRDGAPIDTVSVNTTYYFDETTTPLQVYDYCISAYVTDGTSNYLVGSTNEPTNSLNFRMADGYAVLADGFAGLKQFDISDPANPVMTGSYVPGTEITDYVHTLMIEDHNIVQIWGAWSGGPEIWDTLDTPGEANGLAIIGNSDTYLVADGSAGLGMYWSGEGLFETDRIDTNGDAVAVSVHSVSDSTGYAFVSDIGNGLVIIQLNNTQEEFMDMSSLSTIGEIPLGGSVVGAVMVEDYLYVAVAGFGVRVYDMSNPGSPVEIGSLTDPSITSPLDISESSTRAYLTTDTGLVTLDISDPTAPMIVSNFAHSSTTVAPMIIVDSKAYVARPGALDVIHLPTDVTTGRDCTQGVQATLELPGNIQASYGLYLDQTVVSWTDNSSLETGFRIVRDDASFVDVGPDVTEWIDTDQTYLSNATEYEVYVLDQTSQPLLGGSAVGIFGPETLLPPTDITASQQDDYDDRIVLNWTDAPDEDSYSIMRMDVASGNPLVEIATVSAGVTSYEDFTPDEETQYYYNVVARSSFGGYSVEQSPSIIGMRDDILPPVNVVATDGEFETRVRITWENRSEKTSYYRVLRDGVPIQSITGAGTFTEDNGEEYPLIPGTVYTYDVEAVAPAGFASGGNVDTGYRTLLAP
ncbi:MAG: hypothetical protein GY780_11305, partial [bacterium]|nr:hypothetical protein [bacterium]